MEIERHLGTEDFATLLLFAGNASDSAPRAAWDQGAGHLQQCERCRREYDRMRRDLSALPEAARSATDRPYFFWQRQQAAIRSRIAVEEGSRRSWHGFAWATIAALIVLAALLLNGAKTNPTTQVEIQPDPDQQLLLAVEQALASGVPESLAPAALLAEDIRAAVEPSAASRSSKENHNEN
jgi:predicted anti-sigma-YlaC factor YlaD